MPRMHPVQPDNWAVVTVQMDDGRWLYDAGARAQFPLADARRVACYPERLAAWLQEKGHELKEEGSRVKGQGSREGEPMAGTGARPTESIEPMAGTGARPTGPRTTGTAAGSTGSGRRHGGG